MGVWRRDSDRDRDLERLGAVRGKEATGCLQASEL